MFNQLVKPIRQDPTILMGVVNWFHWNWSNEVPMIVGIPKLDLTSPILRIQRVLLQENQLYIWIITPRDTTYLANSGNLNEISSGVEDVHHNVLPTQGCPKPRAGAAAETSQVSLRISQQNPPASWLVCCISDVQMIRDSSNHKMCSFPMFLINLLVVHGGSSVSDFI